MADLFFVRTRREIERHRRIKVSVAAYAYEYESTSIISDGEFDAECAKVDLSVDTGNPALDQWFRTNFHPDTGMWIGQHPELEKIRKLYHDFYASADG